MKKILLFAFTIFLLVLGGCANTASGADELMPYEENPAEETASQDETALQSETASQGKTVIQGESASQRETASQGETIPHGEAAVQGEKAENANKLPLPTKEEDIPSSVKPDPRTLNEPPGLTVSTMHDTDSVAASCIGFSWNRELSDGSAVCTIACGRHPLDAVYDWGENTPLDTVYDWGESTLYTAFPAGSLPPSEDGLLPGSILPVFYLHFGDILPDTVSVRRWPASYIGDAQGHSADSEDVAAETENDSVILLPLGDGEFVYEVYAQWNETGSANYVFYTLPRLRDETDSLCGLPLAE